MKLLHYMCAQLYANANGIIWHDYLPALMHLSHVLFVQDDEWWFGAVLVISFTLLLFNMILIYISCSMFSTVRKVNSICILVRT